MDNLKHTIMPHDETWDKVSNSVYIRPQSRNIFAPFRNFIRSFRNSGNHSTTRILRRKNMLSKFHKTTLKSLQK